MLQRILWFRENAGETERISNQRPYLGHGALPQSCSVSAAKVLSIIPSPISHSNSHSWQIAK